MLGFIFNYFVSIRKIHFYNSILKVFLILFIRILELES
jgi:hypothetical protein